MTKNFIRKLVFCLAIVIYFNVISVLADKNELNIYKQTISSTNDAISSGSAVIQESTEVTTETENLEKTTENFEDDDKVIVDVKNENNIVISGNEGIINLIIQNINDIKVDTEDGENVNIAINNNNNIIVTGSSGIINLIVQNIDNITTNEKIESEKVVKTTEKSTVRRRSGGSRKKISKEKKTESTSETETEKTTEADISRKARLKIGSNKIMVNNKEYTYDVSPYISDNYTLIPLRAASELFSAAVGWDNTDKTASIISGNTITCFTANFDMIKINGKSYKIAKPPEITNNRIYVPIRALSDALHTDIKWVPETKEIIITE